MAEPLAQEQDTEPDPKKKSGWRPILLWMLKWVLIVNVIGGTLMYLYLSRT